MTGMMYDFWITKEQYEAKRRVDKFIKEVMIDLTVKRRKQTDSDLDDKDWETVKVLMMVKGGVFIKYARH